jgi:hypothetical protein
MKQLIATLGASMFVVLACSSPGPAPAAAPGDAHEAAVEPDARFDGAGGASDRPGGVMGSGGASNSDAAPSGTGAGGASGAIDAGPVDSGSAEVAPTDAMASAGWPAVMDYGARGPWPTMRQTNTGPGGAFDVFRPTELGGQGRKHPIISWANGTLYALDTYTKPIDHWASHGFVIIAGHTNTTAGGGTHKAGIDWLIAENSRAGSPYFGALDPRRIGAAGHSQGGGATIAAGADKPGTTGIGATIPMMPLLSFESDKTVVARQKAPMFNINAVMDDRDPDAKVAAAIFDGATGPLVQGAFAGVHTDAMSAAMNGPTLAWFRLHLMDDAKAAALFAPAGTCGLCQDAAWKQLRSKNLP